MLFGTRIIDNLDDLHCFCRSMMKTPTAAAAVARLYLGTMTFGWSQSSQRVDETVAYDMLERFVAAVDDFVSTTRP